LFVWSTDLALVIDAQDWLTNNRTIPIATATEIKRASATTGLIPEFFLPLTRNQKYIQ
jgi:hypothetical protein